MDKKEKTARLGNGEKAAVEFVSYDGSYPNLCRGKLVVKIGGREVSFGQTKKFWSWDKDEELADYPSFWSSGGSCGFGSDYSDEYVAPGEWQMDSGLDKKAYPKEVLDVLPKVLETMNRNVPFGCCGGCL